MSIEGKVALVTGAGQGGVFRWTAAEEALAADFRVESLADIALDADDIMSDLHGSADYRTHLVKIMAKHAMVAALR